MFGVLFPKTLLAVINSIDVVCIDECSLVFYTVKSLTGHSSEVTHIILSPTIREIPKAIVYDKILREGQGEVVMLFTIIRCYECHPK